MPKYAKGSDEMKKHMEHLRCLRKSKSSHIEKIESPPTESPNEEVVEEIVGTGKKRIN